jgi:hypothetical protein
MTNLRPGLGSCTPNWGTHDDRDLRDFLVGPRPSSSRCGTRPTPPTVGLAPRPVTEESTIEPEGVRRRLHPHRWGNEEKTVAARRPSED